MRITWKSEAASLLMLAAMFGMAAVTWPGAPERMPVHWGLSGQPDRFGGKFEGLLGLPLITLAIYALLLVLPRIDPRRVHYDSFRGAYAVLRTALVGLFFAIAIFTHLWIRGRPIEVNILAPLLVGALMLVLGACLPRLESNWFIGVRTPWTLSSEESWRRTHRLAGVLFATAGVLIIVLSVLWPHAGMWVILCTVFPAALASAISSYFVWRDDPTRATRRPPERR
jgi:uncharacterized membrane protein